MIHKLIFGLMGALTYRLRGSTYGPRWLEELLFILPYCAPGVVEFASKPDLLHLVSVAIVFAFTLAAATTGHGNWQDLGTWTKPSKPERTEFLIAWLKPHLSPYWYDVVGMSLSGFLITLACGISVALFGFHLLGLLIALSGILKSVAYMIGWKVYPTGEGKGIRGLNNADQVAEFLTGLFLWGSLALILS